MGGQPLPGNAQEPAQTENEIYQMGHEKADKIPLHSIFGEQIIEKCHIHGGGQNVVADAGLLLFQPFGHGVGDGVAVQHSIQNVFLRYLAFNHFAVAVTGHTAEPGCWAFLGAGNIPLHNSPALFTIQHSSKRVF